MSLSIVHVAFILFTFLSFSKPNVVIAQTRFTQNCNGAGVKSVIDPNLCLKILESQEKIVSSKNNIELSIAIIDSGISNGTNTRTYIENLLKKGNLDPNLKGVLNECKSSYDYAVGSLNSALGEVKSREYQTASYDLRIASTDAIQQCVRATASKKINDATILLGNKVLQMFGFIGFDIVNGL